MLKIDSGHMIRLDPMLGRWQVDGLDGPLATPERRDGSLEVWRSIALPGSSQPLHDPGW